MLLKKAKALLNYFTKGELLLWCISVALIVVSFCILDEKNYLTLIASLIGATSLIFNAKGNPFGQFLNDYLQYVVWFHFFYILLLW